MNEADRHRGEVLGFREWRLVAGSLSLTSIGYFSHAHWTHGVNHARCLAPEYGLVRLRTMMPPALRRDLGLPPDDILPEEIPQRCEHAPGAHCECGLYALHRPAYIFTSSEIADPRVFGAVLGWGRLRVHPHGWRAEYAEPVILAWAGRHMSYDHVRRIQTVAGELRIPAVPLDELEERAYKIANPVPVSLRPKMPPPPPQLYPLSGPPTSFAPLSPIPVTHVVGKAYAEKQVRREGRWMGFQLGMAAANIAFVVQLHSWLNAIAAAICVAVAESGRRRRKRYKRSAGAS